MWNFVSKGVNIFVGSLVYGWTYGLGAGIWEYFGATLLSSSSFICLFLSLAEMTSSLPFSGGAFGFVRATIGPYLGFLVGIAEVLINGLYVMGATLPLGKLLTLIFDVEDYYEHVFWLVILIISTAIHIKGGSLFWYLSSALASVSLLTLFIYFSATIKEFHYDSNTKFRNYIIPSSNTTMINLSNNEHLIQPHTALSFFRVLPFGYWFYVGMEQLSLVCHESIKVSAIQMISCY